MGSDDTSGTEGTARGRRGGGGSDARRAKRASQTRPRAPYIRRSIPTFDILSEEGLCLIERNADTILEEIGIEFRDDAEILRIFRDAGADVRGERVRFAPGMCRRIVQASAPARFEQHARNPANTVMLGGPNTVLAPGWGPPFVHNLDEGRRYATIEDFRTLVKLCSMLPEYHHSGGVICEPVDRPAT
ncbi:MAG: trimethylamine methyltransferase family protein, partial [Rhodospirillales bacterium]|nr:trimethylamine methyltransferase family protein [Rhodospirillales bacterium]